MNMPNPRDQDKADSRRSNDLAGRCPPGRAKRVPPTKDEGGRAQQPGRSLRTDWPRVALRLTGAFLLGVLTLPAAEMRTPPPLQQPTVIPGSWRLPERSALPPLERIIAAPRTPRPVYAFYCWAEEYRRRHAVLREIGWRNFRLSGPITDEVMRLFVEDDVEVMFTIAARDPFPAPSALGWRWRNRSDFESDEAFIVAYVADVQKVLRRYGPNGTFFREHPALPHRPLRHIEIFNEPNLFYLDRPLAEKGLRPPKGDTKARQEQDRVRQQLYALLLPRAYRAIKAEWPEVKVVGFGTSGGGGADVPFVRGVHAASPEVAGSYDIFSTHPYAPPVAPEVERVQPFGSYSAAGSLAKLRSILAEQGVTDRPVWWTEWNWSVDPESGGRLAPTRDDSENRSVSLELQAAYLVRGYLLALRVGVERLAYMSLVDTDGVNSGILIPGDPPVWRPSAYALKTLLALMPHPRLLGAGCDGVDGVYGYNYESAPGAGADTQVWWAVAGPRSVTVPWTSSSEVEVISMLGERTPIRAQDGVLKIEIGPLPVYLRPMPGDSVSRGQ